MKQRIGIDQLKQLTSGQKDRLRSRWDPEVFDVCVNGHDDICSIGMVKKDYDIRGEKDTWFWFSDEGSSPLTKADVLPLLSIGQCIEILFERDIKFELTDNESIIKGELIDALWEIVKEVLKELEIDTFKRKYQLTIDVELF